MQPYTERKKDAYLRNLHRRADNLLAAAISAPDGSNAQAELLNQLSDVEFKIEKLQAD